MDNLTLNRLGIILNLIGSLLVAPDLIGLKRLGVYEKKLERTVNNLQGWVANTMLAISGSAMMWYVGFFLMFIALFLSFSIFYLLYFSGFTTVVKYFGYCLGDLVFFLVIKIFMYLLETISEPKMLNKFFSYTILIIGFPIYLPCALLALLLIGLPVGVVLLLLDLARIWINIVLHILSGRNRLRRFVIRFGLFLFITGALLQIIATF